MISRATHGRITSSPITMATQGMIILSTVTRFLKSIPIELQITMNKVFSLER